MRKWANILAGVGALFGAMTGVGHATILTFDGLTPGQPIPSAYGDLVSSLNTNGFIYTTAGEGLTPNLFVGFSPSLSVGALPANILAIDGGATGAFSFGADRNAGSMAVAELYDAVFYSATETVLDVLIRVFDENGPIFTTTIDVLTSGTAVSFADNFNTPLRGTELVVGITVNGAINPGNFIGVDDIRFGETSSFAPVPVPGAALFFLTGIGGLVMRRVRRAA